MELILSFLSITLLIGSAGFFGGNIWSLLSLPRQDSVVPKLVIGMAMNSYLLTLLSSLSYLRLEICVLIFCPLCILGYRMIAPDFGNSIKNSGIYANLSNKKVLFSLILIGLILLSCFIEALAPATTEDTLSYHFRIPLDYVKAGELIYSPSHPHNMPHLIQMLVTFPFILGTGDFGGHLIYLVYVIFLIGSIFLLTNKLKPQVGLLAVIMICTTPMFFYIKVSGMVEVGLASTIVLSIWAMQNGFQSEQKNNYSWFILCGILVGLSVSIKYYGLFSLVIISILIFSISIIKVGSIKAIIFLLLFLLAVMAFGFPFYLKNVVMTGNPLYPAFFDLFGGHDWTKILSEQSNSFFNKYKKPGGGGFLDIFLSPWRLTIDGEKFNTGKSGYGFIYLSFLPLIIYAILLGVKNNGLKSVLPNGNLNNSLAWFCILFWVLWFLFAFHRGRHLFPVYCFLSIYCAQLFFKFSVLRYNGKVNAVFSNLIKFIVGFGIFFQLMVGCFFTSTFLPVAIGLENKSSFLSRIRPEWRDYQNIKAFLPPDAKIIHLFGNRQYYLDFNQFYPSPFFQGKIDWTRIPNVNTYRSILKELGYTHIIGDLSAMEYAVSSLKREGLYSNIFQFNSLNAQLIKKYGNEIYSRRYLIRTSRTVPLGSKKRIFSVYEIR